MSGLLTGREMSGTPLETRAGASQLAGLTLGSASGRENALSNLLMTDPGSNLAGLFAALEPFEERETNRQVSGLRSGLGRLGGRFGRSAMDAEVELRSRLGQGFNLNRQQGLLDQNAQILQALLGARGQDLGFFRPGAPNFQEGILGELISAGGNIGSSFALPG